MTAAKLSPLLFVVVFVVPLSLKILRVLNEKAVAVRTQTIKWIKAVTEADPAKYARVSAHRYMRLRLRGTKVTQWAVYTGAKTRWC